MAHPDDLPKLSRKERRALEFGTPEAQAAIRLKLQTRKPFPFDADADIRMIPTIGTRERVEPFMLPIGKIPDEYFDHPPANVNTYAGTAKTPIDMHVMLSVWFFCGLYEFELFLRPNFILCDEKGKTDEESVKNALRVYVHTLMHSMEAGHAHKMAYVAYVLHKCCEKILWTTAKR